MDELVLAGIDIGSNAARLIIKNIVPDKSYKHAILNKLVYLRLPLRLGGDVFKYGYITEKKKAEFIKGMQIYRDLLNFYNVDYFRACATSATRSAKNGIEICKQIENLFDIKIDIIDGKKEAELLFLTNIYNLPDGKIFMSADLGGGSLQVTVFREKSLIWTYSYKIGTVRLLNGTVDKQEFYKFEKDMQKIKIDYPDLQIIGSGGNINKISKITGGKRVKFQELKDFYEKAAKMTVDERIKFYKFRRDRADVIVPAAEIYLKLLNLLDKKEIFVPKIGLADGIIRELYEKYA